MAQNAQNLSDVRVRGCDLFLLEEWDENSSLPPDERMTQIFDRFVKLPVAERQAYTQQVWDRGIQSASQLPQADQDLLARARPYNERNIRSAIWLRTYYGPGSDDALAAILSSSPSPPVPDGCDVVFSNTALYDYGESWQRVFCRMPQLLEITRPGYDYETTRVNALQMCREFEREDKATVEEEGGEWPEDGTYLGDLYSEFHLAAKVGIIYVLDEKMLDHQEEGGQERKMLAAWYDADGKTVRWNRLSPREVFDTWGLISLGGYDDNPIWTKAEIGEGYDWYGLLYVSDEENETDKD